MLNKPKIRNKVTDADDGIELSQAIKSRKKLSAILISIITVLVVAAAIIIPISINRPIIEDDYFISDDTKTTISLTPSTSDPNTTSLIQTHFVYTYDGENVSGLKTYFEYSDEESARTAYESSMDQPEFKGAELKGKFIIVTADESQYKGLTVSDIRQQADAIKKLQDSQNPQPESDETTSKDHPETSDSE